MKLKDAFYSQEKLPLKTIQRKQNQRPNQASKFFKNVAKKYKTGRKPPDIRPRSKEPIPPFNEQQTLRKPYPDESKRK